MVLEITSTLRTRLLKAAQATPEVEACGLLFGTADRIEDVTVCTNVADDPRRTFELDPAAVFAALRAERGGGPRLIGYWHSHPSGTVTPSATDAANAAPDGKVWVIVGGEKIGAWRAQPDASGDPATRFVPLMLETVPDAHAAAAAGGFGQAKPDVPLAAHAVLRQRGAKLEPKR